MAYNRPWTEDELNYLLFVYPTKGAKCAKELNRSKCAVWTAAARYGIPAPRNIEPRENENDDTNDTRT